MEDLKYGMATTLDATMDEAVSQVTTALATEGFGVLTEIDVAATMQKKLGIDHRPYRILGACNPKLAHQAIEADPQIGLLLPCNVVVQKNDAGKVIVSAVSPKAMFAAVDNPDMGPLAEQVEASLKRVIAALEA